jgi:hypothetical protein
MIVIPFVAMYWIVRAYIKWPAARVVLLIIMSIGTLTAGAVAATQDAEVWPAAAFYAVISALMAWHVRHTFAHRRGIAEGGATVEAPVVPRCLDTTPQVRPAASSTQAATVAEQAQRSPDAELEYQRAAVAFRMLLAKRALAGIAGPASDTGTWQRIPS